MERQDNADNIERDVMDSPKDLKQLTHSELRLEMIKKKARTRIILDQEDQNLK